MLGAPCTTTVRDLEAPWPAYQGRGRRPQALRLYVNGVQVSSRAQKGNLVTSTNPLPIGRDSIFGRYFQGTIDAVRMYNRALSPSEIQADMGTPIR